MKSFAEMINGYCNFRRGDWLRQNQRWETLRHGQSPQVMVIACSDSRVDPAQIFDVDPGEIFVVRNVAALVPPFESSKGQHGVSAAIEFAVQFLKVKEIVVLGHGLCGGCQAALTQSLHGTEPGQGGFVASWIGMLDEVREPIADEFGTSGRSAELAMEHRAVELSLSNLETFPFIRDHLESGELQLHGAHFAISDGVLNLLDQESGSFSPVD